MVELKTPYEILEVSENANKKEIKKAYRKLALKLHPDKGGSDEKFKELASAYEILINEEKLKEYKSKVKPEQQYDYVYTIFQNVNDVLKKHSDILSELFRDFYKTSKKGEDIQIQISLSLNEISKDKYNEVEYKRNVKCNVCKGKGGVTINNCTSCGGIGLKNKTQNTAFGSIFFKENCNNCNGEGYLIIEICETCSGLGYIPINFTTKIFLPANKTSNLIVNGFGGYIRNGNYGNLLIDIVINKDLKIDGKDVIYNLSLSIAEACLGTEVEIETISGIVKIKIEAGTQSGEILRLKGKGLKLNGQPGDMLINISIWTPQTLSQLEKTIMKDIIKNDLFKD